MPLTLALNKSSNQKDNSQKLFKNRKDKESIRGAFTWLQISKYNIPSIIRVTNGERLRFVSVRMAETNLFKKYLPSLHSDLLELVFVKFYLMTYFEAKLFNEINRVHSNNFYGENSFSTTDYIVRFEDMYEFYEYIEFCYTKLFYNVIPDHEEKCGFIKINFKLIVPYIMKDSIKYVPLLYFDFIDKNLTQLNLTQQCVKIKGWSLAYLKFCCKVQGIRKNLYSSDSCRMISIDVIKCHLSPKTHFEDFWPNFFNKSQLINDDIEAKESGSWIRKSLVKAENTHSSKTPVIPHSMPVITNVQELKKKQMELSEIQQHSSIIINNTVNIPQLPPPSPPTSTAFSILNTRRNSFVASEMIDLTSPPSSPAPNNQEEKVYTPISDVQLKRKSEQLLHGTSMKNAYKGLSEIQQGSNAINSIVKVPQLPPPPLPPSPPPPSPKPPSPPPAIPLFRLGKVETQDTDSQTVIPQIVTALTNNHGIQDNQMGLAIISQGSSLMNNVSCILQIPPPPPALPIFQVGRVETQNIE